MSPAHRFATLADLIAFEEGGGSGELIGGEIVEKAAPTPRHANAHSGVVGSLWPAFHRTRGDDDRPGGWWILTEVDVAFAEDVLRPDIAGWRRDRHPECPKDFPVREAPDWVCEVLSPSTAGRDFGPKLRIYHRHGVTHYWVVDVEHGVLMVYRRAEEAYALVSSVAKGLARVEPFDAIELDVDALFGRT